MGEGRGRRMFGIRTITTLLRAFPKDLKGDVLRVLAKASTWGAWRGGRIVDARDAPAIENGSIFDRPYSSWKIRTGETIRVLYRVYLEDSVAEPDEIFTPTRAAIYRCLFSRSHDGYVRERHIRALLSAGPPDWAIPYVVEVCGEYVFGIVDFVYRTLQGTDTSAYKETCALNVEQFALAHCRMISYWNEYHRRTRRECYRYDDHVGKKLFEEHFGYDRAMERRGPIRRA